METSHEDFVIDPAAGGGLGPWADALARKLVALNESDTTRIVVISGAEGTGPYVQFLIPHTPGVWCEAVSNEYLAGTEWELDVDQEATLVELGWLPPTKDAPDPHGSGLPADVPNWWAPLERPVDLAELAELTAATLVTVYGFDECEPWLVSVSEGPCDGCWDR